MALQIATWGLAQWRLGAAEIDSGDFGAQVTSTPRLQVRRSHFDVVAWNPRLTLS